MEILRRETAPRYIREEGISSYLLASARTCEAQHLTVTLVEIEPGGAQRVHSHKPEQMYYVLEGTGQMTVSNDTGQVGAGDCIFIPSGAPHGLMNDGQVLLAYLSAAAPPFKLKELQSLWPLESEKGTQGEHPDRS